MIALCLRGVGNASHRLPFLFCLLFISLLFVIYFIIIIIIFFLFYLEPLADPELQLGGAHGERGARAYNGGLGTQPPAGSRGRAPGQGVRGAKPP